MHQSTYHRGCLFCRPALLLPLFLAHNSCTGIKGLLLGSCLAMKVPWRPPKKRGNQAYSDDGPSHHSSFPRQDVPPLQSSFSMPCARCGSWEEFPSWHLCETACANERGVAKLHTGEEIQCNKSWNDTWWFFFCNKCKHTRFHIRGVLRNESCTQEAAEVLIHKRQWQAFDSTDGKGTWWWNRYTGDWFLESEPGDWTLLNNFEGNQPHWCHPDGRCFDASLDPWLIKQDSEDGWQAFEDENGKGTWWWNRHTEDWLLESEPGDWMLLTDSVSGQPYWCHLDGRYFCASLDPWLIKQQSDDD